MDTLLKSLQESGNGPVIIFAALILVVLVIVLLRRSHKPMKQETPLPAGSAVTSIIEPDEVQMENNDVLMAVIAAALAAYEEEGSGALRVRRVRRLPVQSRFWM